MIEFEDDSDLKSSLKGYLSAQLDGQLGRAAAAFQNEVAIVPVPIVDGPCVPAGSTGSRRSSPRLRVSRRRWSLAAASAVAACVTLAAIWWNRGRDDGLLTDVAPPPLARSAADIEPASAEITPAVAAETDRPRLIGQRLRWRTLDEGIVMLDDHTAARKLRRQWFERSQYVDPATGAVIETVVPHEDVLFVGLPTY